MQLSKYTPSQYIKAGLFLLGAWLLMSYLSYTVLVTVRLVDFDFFPRWVGTRQMLYGEDPYDVDADVPDEVYDGVIQNLHPPYLLYTATITYILLPFWLVSWEIAISAWCGLTLLLLLMIPMLMFLSLNWQIRPWMLAFVTFLSLFVYRHSMNSYVLGQFTVFILACLIVTWWLAKENKPVLAAAVLVGATIRPEGIVFTAGLLALFIVQRNYKLVVAWSVVMGILFLGSVIQIGFWIPDFLDGIRRYQNLGLSEHPSTFFSNDGASAAIIVFVVLWGLWMWWQMYSSAIHDTILWSLATLVVVCLLVLPQSKSYTLVYLLLPLWLVIWESEGRWRGLGPVALLFISPWFYLGLKPYVGDVFPQGDSMISWEVLEQFLTPLATGVLLTASWLRWKQRNMQHVANP
jgi:hypothetical protein